MSSRTSQFGRAPGGAPDAELNEDADFRNSCLASHRLGVTVTVRLDAANPVPGPDVPNMVS